MTLWKYIANNVLGKDEPFLSAVGHDHSSPAMTGTIIALETPLFLGLFTETELLREVVPFPCIVFFGSTNPSSKWTFAYGPRI